MEGVGARLGRSSTLYGPATVFTGPVRKWKKKWVHVPPPNSNHNHHSAANGTVNGSNGSSHLLLYKWTPIIPNQNKDSSNSNNDGNNSNGNADFKKNSHKLDAVASEEPPKRKFKYIPIIVLEEQINESLELSEDEAKQMETELEATSKNDGCDEKPDINDVPMDENQDSDNIPVERQDLNESTLDLSLGLKAHDDENDSGTKADQAKDD